MLSENLANIYVIEIKAVALTFRSARADLKVGATKSRGFPRCTRNKRG